MPKLQLIVSMVHKYFIGRRQVIIIHLKYTATQGNSDIDFRTANTKKNQVHSTIKFF